MPQRSANINTPAYWENRFASGDWDGKSGRTQTRCFAEALAPHLKLDADFAGSILDFGCGLGDALPVYRERFPKAELRGLDISEHAVEQCRQKYGAIATFIAGDYRQAPETDVIIASNVLEHLDDDLEVARSLRSKCKHLYIVVPYREQDLDPEHVRRYDEHHFAEVGPCECRIFPSRTWSEFGLKVWTRIHLGNVFRRMAGRKLRHRRMQIIFCFLPEEPR